MTPSIDTASAALQAVFEEVVSDGHWVSIIISPVRMKSEKGRVRCLVQVLTPPAEDGSQTERAKAVGPDLGEAIKSVLRGEHVARKRR